MLHYRRICDFRACKEDGDIDVTLRLPHVIQTEVFGSPVFARMTRSAHEKTRGFHNWLMLHKIGKIDKIDREYILFLNLDHDRENDNPSEVCPFKSFFVAFSLFRLFLLWR